MAQDWRKERAGGWVKVADREWVAGWARAVAAPAQAADAVWAAADAEDNQREENRKRTLCQRETEQDQTDKDPARDGTEAREVPALMGLGREENVFVRDAEKPSAIPQGSRVLRSHVRNAAVR